MDTNILQEYLIQVGVRSDTGALSKFNSIITAIEKTAVGLTAALAAGALAIEGFVYVTTNEMDDLYWATKRMRSSASDIQDFQLRMQKAGSTTAEAQSNLEALAAFRRTNPAGDSFLRLIGVDPTSGNVVKIMDSLIARFKQLNAQGQYWLAVKWGEQIGLDERQVWNMVQTSAKAEHVYADMYRRLGINQKQALQNAHDYQNKLKDLDATLKVVSSTLGLKFLPVANDFLEWLMTSPAAAQIGTALLDITTSVGKLADQAAKVLGAMPPEAQEFGIIGFFLFGRKGALILGLIGAASALLDKMSGDKGVAGGSSKPEVREAGESKDNAKSRWAFDNGLGFLNTNKFNTNYAEYQEEKKAGKLPKTPLVEPAPPKKTGMRAWADWLEGFATPFKPDDLSSPFGEPAAPAPGKKTPLETGKPAPDKQKPLGVRSNNPGNLQPGGKEAVYKTPEEGLKDMGRLLLSYSRQGLTSIKDIISKFAPEFDKNGKHINNTQAYINRVAKEMGVAATAGLNLNNPDTLKRLMASMIRFEEGYAPYSDKLIGDAANAAAQAGKAAATGASPKATANATSSPAPAPQIGFQSAPLGAVPASKSVTVHQTNNTTIHGAKDPAETATKVSRVMDRAQGDLVRNFSPALI